LLIGGLDGHGLVKVLEIVLFIYPRGKAGAATAGRHAVSSSTAAPLGERSAGTGEQSDSYYQYSHAGRRYTRCRHATRGNGLGRYAGRASSSLDLEHRPDL